MNVLLIKHLGGFQLAIISEIWWCSYGNAINMFSDTNNTSSMMLLYLCFPDDR